MPTKLQSFHSNIIWTNVFSIFLSVQCINNINEIKLRGQIDFLNSKSFHFFENIVCESLSRTELYKSLKCFIHISDMSDSPVNRGSLVVLFVNRFPKFVVVLKLARFFSIISAFIVCSCCLYNNVRLISHESNF